MWKLVLGFVLFAALALYILSKGGNIDMGGEKHDVTAHEEPAAAASSPASAVLAPASAASN